MSIKSSNNKALGPWTSVPPLPRIVQYDGTNKWYYPLITPTNTLTWNGYRYSYDKNVGDTFGIGLSNTKYVIPNKRTAVATYDIPAGTYSPSTFENMIRNFISNNGSRKVSNSFSVVVNGQTYNVPSGRAICYTYQYSGKGRFVTFSGSQRGGTAFQLPSAFTNYGVYCTYWSYTSVQGTTYYNYNIKVNNGIKFS